MKLKLLIHAIVISTILLVAVAPVLSVIAASAIANRLGCRLDESGVHPCDYNGRDIGSELLTMAMMGWLGSATLPLGGMALILYLLIALIYEVARYSLRRRKQAQTP
jgi:hypothetical protein